MQHELNRIIDETELSHAAFYPAFNPIHVKNKINTDAYRLNTTFLA
jgi:hypothetical protein